MKNKTSLILSLLVFCSFRSEAQLSTINGVLADGIIGTNYIFASASQSAATTTTSGEEIQEITVMQKDNQLLEHNATKFIVSDRNLGANEEKGIKGDYYTWKNAKYACRNLGHNWRLPSKDELEVIRLAVTFENKVWSLNSTVFPCGCYWSSTDAGDDYAWFMYLDIYGDSGITYPFLRWWGYSIRCVKTVTQ